ncbi:valyl-tRNA synthetase [Deferribacter desulfuricans SSM1]|uniref:Valine--tRNA ligase n=1 Tax=Deferribacter desulfuricans (strain DSM 14783 / JCM 11476 / NBRC 101012 / SSM1) TaxID=639282 RepID=D3PBM8_DEFDS|nr:valine--tRNA ligase [Deferribacter desulfuricans]BAI80001.1 valyl-tRNA synthetase [Deferribacter desulfuricans SSM1]
MKEELPIRIDPADFEEKLYNEWLEKKYFHANENSDKPPYSIVIPPPNVTGSLHMGHALNNTLQDILIRYHRMKGFEVLWLPGTDHAGIATQNVVERMLAQEGLSRHDLGREKFIERVWQWREESGGQIINQLKRLGASCDWNRERFTMDEGLSNAVRTVFVTLYKEGLIYRSNYIINWCPRCHTALSDLEVEHEDKEGALYYIYYPIENSDEKLLIATTRPETMLGDTAVAVNPNDERYKHLIGKYAILPILNRRLPIIADEYVDMEFGTGALKVTPAHDPNDFELGKKYGLEEINVMDDSGIINENGGKYKGLDRFEARKQIVEELKNLGYLEKIEKHDHSVGHCYRCKTVVEPRISMQWFVKIKPLAEKAIEAVEQGKIKIFPEMWTKTYFEWMYNIRDWCISRQIWWGHRIPAWYCEKCGHINVDFKDPEKCEKCGSTELTQETDVLDTWFSSALWPFSTMGWPEKTKTLEKFYPTSCLVTGFDILFFWVARMIMMGLKFMNDVPFYHVYIHALVRDQYGQKMSKSKGNVIDPLIMIEKYGADAFRFTLAAFAAQGRDIKLSEDRIVGYKNFVNKIWNASRFLMMNLDENISEIDFDNLEMEDKWILHNLYQTAKNVEKFIKSYDFNEAANEIYQFFWHIFCDWYIEFIKHRIYNNINKTNALAVAKYTLEESLKILHPFMPFITEFIYKKLSGKETINFGPYPEKEFLFDADYKNIEKVITLISNVRTVRGEYNIPPAKNINIFIKTSDEMKSLIEQKSDIIKKLAKIENINFTDKEIEKSAVQIEKDFTVFVPLEGLIDFEAEIKRLEKEKKGYLKDINIYGKKLNNEEYLKKAPEHIIEKDKAKYEEAKLKLEEIDKSIERLKSLC